MPVETIAEKPRPLGPRTATKREGLCDEDTLPMDSIKVYVRQTRTFPVLPPETQLELAGRARDGDKQASEELTKASLGLITSMVFRKYHPGNGMDYLDFIQEGNMSLMCATENYDPTQGRAFTTHVTYQARTAIRKALKHQDPSMKDTVPYTHTPNKDNDANDEQQERRINAPSPEHFTELLVNRLSQQEYLRKVLRQFSSRDQGVIFLRICCGWQLKDVAKFFGISLKAVDQLTTQELPKRAARITFKKDI
jgi:RNA polymerase sigma factor (sigma-70 family)